MNVKGVGDGFVRKVAPDGSGCIEVPLIVIAGLDAANGSAVEVWPATANIVEETESISGIVLLPIDSTPD